MEINEYISKIKSLNACKEAVVDAHNYKTSQELWDDWKRGDLMLWLIGRLAGEPGSEKRKKLVLTASKCARLDLPYAKEDELRPPNIIETAEQWAKGENNITLNDVKASAVYAAAAASAASAASAVYAAATAAAAASAASALAAYARTKVLAQCADIVRADYPNVDDLWKDGGKC